MKLGILVNTDTHLDEIIGIAHSAVSKGHEVVIFTMDSGTKLFRESAFSEMCSLQGISMSFCDLSTKKEGVETDGLTDEIVCGSQYDNSQMMHNCDKVIVL